jgi:hypothetical protein
MAITFVLSDHIGRALSLAEYDKLEDGTFAGRIPDCKGVAAFGMTLRKCEAELRSIECGILGGAAQIHASRNRNDTRP